MLTHDLPVNYLHWLAPDDTHILIEGGPVEYFMFHPDGRAEKVTVGLDFPAGQRPVVAVPGGCWKALRLDVTSNRVKIGAGADRVKCFANSASWRLGKHCAN